MTTTQRPDQFGPIPVLPDPRAPAMSGGTQFPHTIVRLPLATRADVAQLVAEVNDDPAARVWAQARADVAWSERMGRFWRAVGWAAVGVVVLSGALFFAVMWWEVAHA